MAPIIEARKLANYIVTIPDIVWIWSDRKSYNNMGATLTDAGLQAGLNYNTVVMPRVKRVLSLWPGNQNTSDFLKIMDIYGYSYVLDWSHPEKPRRIVDMAKLIGTNNIESEDELGVWLSVASNKLAMLNIEGIGPKTIDYLLMLTGTPTLAIDRHLKKFANSANVNFNSYDEIKMTYHFAADLLGIDYDVMDKSIWSYYVNSSKTMK